MANSQTQMRQYLNCIAVSPPEKSWQRARRTEGEGRWLLRKPKNKHANKESLQWTLDQANATQLYS